MTALPVYLRLSLFLLFLLLCFRQANAQDADSLAARTSDNHVPESWKKYYLGLRLGGGAQKAFFGEAGFCLQKFFYEARHGYVATTWYGSLEWIPSQGSRKTIYGFKAGGEFVNNGGTEGFEIKYMYNKDTADWVITPHIGFGIGTASVLYGYNFSINGRPFTNIGRHQFMLVINTSLFTYYWKHKDKK